MKKTLIAVAALAISGTAAFAQALPTSGVQTKEIVDGVATYDVRYYIDASGDEVVLSKTFVSTE